MNTVFQRCVNYALKKVCFHNTPWCVNLHTPKTHLIMCYFKDKRCVWRTHHGVFWEHTCFYSALRLLQAISVAHLLDTRQTKRTEEISNSVLSIVSILQISIYDKSYKLWSLVVQDNNFTKNQKL